MNAHAKIQALVTTLDQLKPGHEFPGANINSRTADRAAEVEQLAASIHQDGLLLPLVVVPAPNALRGFFVVDGNRRLSALNLLVKQKKLDKDAEIDIRVEKDLDAATALRKSLAANMHVPLHPVDQFEAFAACMEKGDTIEQIADRYALTPKVVKQRLALAGLAPEVRDAWRKGKIGRDAAEAYACTADKEAQARLIKRGGWEASNAHTIRQKLRGDQHGIQQFMTFVGEDAYKAAGGKLVEDLFGEKGGNFADFPLLQKLASAKIEEEKQKYLDKGWGWAALDQEPGMQNRWNWDRKKNPTADEKKKCGVILTLEYTGKLTAETGYIKPGTKGVKSATGESPKGKAQIKKPSNAVSNSLRQDLTAMGWRAIQDALRTEKGTPLAALLGEVVAAQINPGRFNSAPDQINRNMSKLMEAITPAIMTSALQKRFDVKRYFPNAPKGLVVQAIREVVGETEAKKYAAGTKAAAWKFALANVAKTGWLPKELRTARYKGPTAKAPAKDQPKKKAS